MSSARQATRGRSPKTVGQPPLGRVLGQVERQVTRRVEKTLAAERLTVDQWRVLDVLADRDGQTMTELAVAIVVPGPTLTKILDKLVDAALLYRLVDERDRRRVLAYLSEKGKEVHANLAPKVAATEAEALTSIGGDRSLLVELLAQLARSYDESLSRS